MREGKVSRGQKRVPYRFALRPRRPEKGVRNPSDRVVRENDAGEILFRRGFVVSVRVARLKGEQPRIFGGGRQDPPAVFKRLLHGTAGQMVVFTAQDRTPIAGTPQALHDTDDIEDRKSVV